MRVVGIKSCRAYNYTGNGKGALLLTKVVLGKVRYVSGWGEVTSCPPGYNSVGFLFLSGLQVKLTFSLLEGAI